ncbi:MAG: hypothetical protein MUF00_08610 [Gemmatimonadaceae bacterium]|jgi:hypothetical protein|nr:hypothetical protein [Gemmatimonadaceae bacterium]
MGITARLTDGRTIQLEDRAINSGAEKTVFFTRDRRHVVGFFYGKLADRLERVDRLTRILTKYNPTTGRQGEYWAPYYCWPTGVVDGDRGIPEQFARQHSLVWPVLGVMAPTYRSQFFFTDRLGQRQEKEVKWFTGRKAGALVPESERGSLLTRLQICTRLARAVRRMHFAGLAHSDLSNKNVLIDPKSGDACVIDIDSLVVPGVAPPAVLGTPGYIAPEVLAGRAKPSIDTDKHALAVLIYQILLHRHPLQGKKVHSTRSAEEDETLSMGARALFVEHPTDRSNPSVVPIVTPFARLGPHLEALFIKTFVHGLHVPGRRADAAEWELALYRTLNQIHPLPSGRQWAVVGPGLAFGDPATGERVTAPVPIARYLRDAGDRLIDERQTLTIFHNLVLHVWHTRAGIWPDEHASRVPQGYFSQHGGKWWMVNLTDTPMRVIDGPRIERNGSIELVPGLAVRMTDDALPARVLQFDFLHPQ